MSLLFTVGSFLNTQIYLRSIMLLLFMSIPIKINLFSSFITNDHISSSADSISLIFYKMATIGTSVILFMYWYYVYYSTAFVFQDGVAYIMKIIIVGSGLFGAVFAHEVAERGNKVTVIEKRNHIAGNIYTKEVDGIQVHEYGAHIFHTSNKKIWDYVHKFAKFNRYTNSPVANYKGQMYNLPFNMNTFNEMWGVRTPQEALAKINEQRLQKKAQKHLANLPLMP